MSIGQRVVPHPSGRPLSLSGPRTSELYPSLPPAPGTLLRPIWDQWWHGENRIVAGSPEVLCPLCNAGVCSQAHILCECPNQEPFRREHIFSINGAAHRFPSGPKQALVLDFSTWLSTGHPYTSMFSFGQSLILHSSIHSLPLTRSRALRTGHPDTVGDLSLPCGAAASIALDPPVFSLSERWSQFAGSPGFFSVTRLVGE